MIDGLAFLPLGDVNEGIDILRESVPRTSDDEEQKLMQLLDYFQSTYISGAARLIARPTRDNPNSQVINAVRIRRLAPLFPPELWNVYQSTVDGTDRTNNLCESWNRGFGSLVGNSHPSLYAAIQALQRDAAIVSCTLEMIARGRPPIKRTKRSSTELNKRLKNICQERGAGVRNITETLTALGHTIELNHL